MPLLRFPFEFRFLNVYRDYSLIKLLIDLIIFDRIISNKVLYKFEAKNLNLNWNYRRLNKIFIRFFDCETTFPTPTSAFRDRFQAFASRRNGDCHLRMGRDAFDRISRLPSGQNSDPLINSNH